MKQPISSSISGQIAVITGAGRGIGAATARLLARQGARVVLVSRTVSEITEVAAEIERECGAGHALAYGCDVSDEASVRALFEKTLATFGHVTLLMNNAAVIDVVPFEKSTVESWDRTMAVNLRGPYLCSRELFAHARASGKGGAIVNLSSLGGLRGTDKFKGFASYSTSKFGVIGLTECLAVEGRELRVRANCIAPGAVDTKMLKQAAPFLKTNTTPDDIAKIALTLFEPGETNGTVVEVHSNIE